jgi:hypothetical protein
MRLGRGWIALRLLFSACRPNVGCSMERCSAWSAGTWTSCAAPCGSSSRSSRAPAPSPACAQDPVALPHDPLPQVVLDELAAHLAKYPSDGPLFPGRDGGPIVRTRFDSVWRATLNSAGVTGVTFHICAAPTPRRPSGPACRAGGRGPARARRRKHDLERVRASLGRTSRTAAARRSTRCSGRGFGISRTGGGLTTSRKPLTCSYASGQVFCGNPRLIPPWLGSNQRAVTTFPRVKKCTPSTPWAWLSPNSEDFQPPKE